MCDLYLVYCELCAALVRLNPDVGVKYFDLSR